jgi:hypothetical protein
MASEYISPIDPRVVAEEVRLTVALHAGEHLDIPTLNKRSLSRSLSSIDPVKIKRFNKSLTMEMYPPPTWTKYPQ